MTAVSTIKSEKTRVRYLRSGQSMSLEGLMDPLTPFKELGSARSVTDSASRSSLLDELDHPCRNVFASLDNVLPEALENFIDATINKLELEIAEDFSVMSYLDSSGSCFAYHYETADLATADVLVGGGPKVWLFQTQAQAEETRRQYKGELATRQVCRSLTRPRFHRSLPPSPLAGVLGPSAADRGRIGVLHRRPKARGSRRQRHRRLPSRVERRPLRVGVRQLGPKEMGGSLFVKAHQCRHSPHPVRLQVRAEAERHPF